MIPMRNLRKKEPGVFLPYRDILCVKKAQYSKEI